jgi:hypothetical protein
MTGAMLSQVAAWVSRELRHEFAGVLPEPVITACARDPVVDLRGLSQRRSTTGDGRQAGHGAADDDSRSARASGAAISSRVDRSSARRRTAWARRRPQRRKQQ